MKQIPLGEYTGKLGYKSINTGAKHAVESGFRLVTRDHRRFVEVPDEWGGQPAVMNDDDRWKKARADKAELDLAERRGEIAKSCVALFFEAFAYALPFYKEKLMETSLNAEDQKLLDAGLEKMKTEMQEYIRKRLAHEKTPEPETDDE